MASLFQNYALNGAFDEMFAKAEAPRAHYEGLFRFLKNVSGERFQKMVHHAELSLLTQGVTYTVYSDSQGIEKILPFDVIPRIISAAEWDRVSRGLKQRVLALNAFLHDVYHEGNILRAGVIPEEAVLKNPLYRPEMKDVSVPGDVYVHVSGIDLIRDEDGTFRVLEDNLRCPSGVSYVLENREMMRRIMPDLFSQHAVRSVSDYPHHLLATLQSFAPHENNPNAVLLSPGIYNSAYYEHVYLASRMGIPLVEGQDLIAKSKKIFMKTTSGLERVDVIYRRIDDEFLDPKVFRKDSVLGVAGLFEAYAAGNVVLANAIGNGIADDKGIYPYVPRMIEFYLQETPLLPGVQTYHLEDPKDRDYVMDNLHRMVVKTVYGSGGYGMLVGSHATEDERREFAAKISKNPRDYIAQPVVSFSCHPTFIKEEQSLQPRRVDLRPYILMDASRNVRIVPGGLSRVALVKDSLVVNSSQGGGGKDTWVLASGSNEAESGQGTAPC